MKNEIEIFSAEERAEISARIEAASAREAVSTPGFPSKEQGARRGIFPLLVNAGAFVFLAIGLFLLFYFQRVDDAQIRESGAAFSVTARALINEIRKEVTMQLGEKEAAIETMNARIADIDAQLKHLGQLQNLSKDQREAMEQLKNEQEEYKTELARLQVEKARILTEARLKEAEAIQRDERERTHLRQQQLVLSSGAFQGDSEEMRAAREAFAALSDEEQKAALKQQLDEQVAFLSEQDSAFSELHKTFTELLQLYNAQEKSLADKERQLEEKDKQIADKDRQLTEKNQHLTDKDRQLTEKNQHLTDKEQQLSDKDNQLADKDRQLTDKDRQLANKDRQLTDKDRQLAEKERIMDSLKEQNTSYAQNIESLQNTISRLRAALEE